MIQWDILKRWYFVYQRSSGFKCFKIEAMNASSALMGAYSLGGATTTGGDEVTLACRRNKRFVMLLVVRLLNSSKASLILLLKHFKVELPDFCFTFMGPT